MKWLLILLIPFHVEASIVCGTNTEAEVNTCNLDDKLTLILGRLYPGYSYKTLENYNAPDPCVDEPCPPWNPKENAYAFNPQTDPVSPLYDLLLMESKPAKSVFDADLVAWKNEEIAKVQWRDRVNGLADKYIRPAMIKCGYNQPNSALFMKAILDSSDTIKMDCLESKKTEIDTEEATALAIEQHKKDIAFGKAFAEEYSFSIKSKNHTAAQSLELANRFSGIRTLLLQGNLTAARDNIALVTPDALISQAEIDALVAKINAYLP